MHNPFDGDANSARGEFAYTGKQGIMCTRLSAPARVYVPQKGPLGQGAPRASACRRVPISWPTQRGAIFVCIQMESKPKINFGG